MVRRLRSVHGRSVMLAWMLVVVVLVMAFAAPVQAAAPAIPSQGVLLSHQLRSVPLVQYTSTPLDTAGRVATLPADRVPGTPLVLYTSTLCDTAGYVASSLAGQVANATPMLSAIGDGCTAVVSSAPAESRQLRMVSGR